MFSSFKYHPVRSSLSEDAEFESKSGYPSQSELEESQRINHHATSLRLVAPWIASTVLFAILAAYFAVESVRHATAPLPGPFKTDFRAAQASVEYEERVFTGALDYDPVSGQAYRVLDAFQPQYFGEPSAEIEEAWDELLRGEFPIMFDSEAAPFTSELQPLPTDGEYHFEFDVFHSLHCLNAVRKKLDEYFLTPCQELPRDDTVYSDNWERVHIDHRLDQLRQSVQCHGDLSPVPLYWWQGFQLALGKGHTHTCRKWEPVRAWMDRRGATKRSSDES